MHIFLLLFMVFTAPFSLRSAQDQASLHVMAENYYKRNSFQEALDAYTLIQPSSPTLWFNKGNCYYQLADYALALVCWRRAQLHASHNLWIQAEKNCRLVQNNNNLSAKNSFTSAYAYLQLLWIGYDIFLLQIIFLALFYLALLAPYLFHTARVSTLIRRFLCVLLPIVFFVIVDTTIMAQRIQKMAVITSSSCAVYAGPDEAYYVLTTLPVATQVELRESVNGWSKIIIKKSVGWIRVQDRVAIVSEQQGDNK